MPILTASAAQKASPRPGALRLADAFQRFGDRRLTTITALRGLPDAAQWLAVDPRIAWYASDDPTIASTLTQRARHDGIAVAPAGPGVAIVVAPTDRVSGHLRNGLVQAGCALMTADQRQDRWTCLVTQGESILSAARRDVRSGKSAEAYSDLVAIKRLCETPGDQAMSDALAKPIGTATAHLAAQMDGDAPASINAALIAAYCKDLDLGSAYAVLILAAATDPDVAYTLGLAAETVTARPIH